MTGGMYLLEPEEAVQLLHQYIDSREWWIIPAVGDANQALMERVECTYYSGKANADFHTMLTPGFAVFFIAFARKSRMSAGELADVMAEENTPEEMLAATREALAAGQDVLLSSFDNEREDVMERAYALNAQLYGAAA